MRVVIYLVSNICHETDVHDKDKLILVMSVSGNFGGYLRLDDNTLPSVLRLCVHA